MKQFSSLFCVSWSDIYFVWHPVGFYCAAEKPLWVIQVIKLLRFLESGQVASLTQILKCIKQNRAEVFLLIFIFFRLDIKLNNKQTNKKECNFHTIFPHFGNLNDDLTKVLILLINNNKGLKGALKLLAHLRI